jgi:hypothetical protein
MRTWIPLLALLALTATPGQAQITLGLEVGTEWYGGVSRSTEDARVGFRPDRPTLWGLRAESPGARFRVGMSAHYARPDYSLSSPEILITERATTNHLGSLQVIGILRLATPREGVTLRGELGPVFELWKHEGEDDVQARLGGVTGLSLEVGLGGRFSGTLGGYVSVLPTSPLAGLALPEGYETVSAWRRGIRVGLRLGR